MQDSMRIYKERLKYNENVNLGGGHVTSRFRIFETVVFRDDNL